MIVFEDWQAGFVLAQPVVRVNDSGFFSFSSELLNLSTIAVFGLDSLFEKAYPCR